MKRPYHHGDLRAALIEAGLRLLAEQATDDLSLRELARNVGVSPTAVYRHFPDKGALMSALAQAGLARLAEAQRAASEAVGGGPAGFSATGRAYVRFALANPALFRMIFSAAASVDVTATASASTPDALILLKANAEAIATGDDGARAVAVKAVAVRAWSIAHGLAMLMLNGQIPPDDALIDNVISGAAGSNR